MSTLPIETPQATPRRAASLRPPLSPPAATASSTATEPPTLRSHLATLLAHRWTVLGATSLAVVAGAVYLLLAAPTYQVDCLLHLDRPAALTGLEDPSATPSPAETEIEILRSRAVLGAVVDELRLDVLARPRSWPVIGAALARYRSEDARIGVSRLEVPSSLIDRSLRLVAGADGAYDLVGPDGPLGQGRVGQLLATGELRLLVTELAARPGTGFELRKLARGRAISGLQDRLSIAERGRKTGIIRIALAGPDPEQLAATVNAVARTYVRQSIERQSADVERTLSFVTGQLPQLKANMDKAEAALNDYRESRGGGTDLSLETKAVLDRVAGVEQALSQIELQRPELRQKFTADHPSVVALEEKAAQLRAERADIERRFRSLPRTEVRLASLTRDAKVASDLYMLLLNKAQELNVMRSSTQGKADVRLVDEALVPDAPTGPKAVPTIALCLALGLMLGVALAMLRTALGGGVEDPRVLERVLGLNVYATIPHSRHEGPLTRAARRRRSDALRLLARDRPHDAAVEAIRSLRTSVAFALSEAPNHVVALAGPAPDEGKSFLCANLACVLADAGKRVLLVDADMRRGELHAYFGGARTPGLAEVIRGDVEASAAVLTTEVAHLDLLPTGERPPNPSELLASPRFGAVIEWAARTYDVILLDTAPVLAVADAVLAARTAGTTLLVLRAGQHPIREIELTLGRLAQGGVTAQAAVLNDVPKGDPVHGFQYAYR